MKVDASTGQIQATFNVVPNGCNGGGIWSTPVVPSDGKVYVSTGNPGNCNEPYAIAIVELNASDLSLVGYSHISTGSGDWDFASVTPFSANGTNYIGAINKNGTFYAFRQNALSAGTAWQASIAAASDCPQCGGNIAPAAFDGSRLYVAGGRANGCAGTVNALNPATGAFEWRHCLNAPVLGAVTVFPGVVVVGAGRQVYAVNASTGASLYTYSGSGIFWGPPTVAEGMLFEGNQNGQLLAFAPTPAPSSGNYKIVNRNSGQALDITNNSTSNGGLAIQWPYHAGTNQQWQKISVNRGYKLINRNSGLLLDNPNGSKTNRTRLDQWHNTNTSNQWWNLVSAGNGYYYIVNQSSGLYADVVGASTTAGASVVEWPSDGRTNQQWQLIPV